ncbi:MAG: hypothetical protein A3B70_03335 [Deltaproteobacteria bacterium RIFCSPHIGHO2_02_FULL_40_11]|nr:MAG: hypothetical protein A3B70_03335 [Deltaproteobacteria bacterium RIFCSPHIGHO2_02_FULL_40_11]
MIKDPKQFKQWEQRFLSKDKLPYSKSLAIFTHLWKEATQLGVLPSQNPMEGIETDIQLAKILNSCLKKSSQK